MPKQSELKKILGELVDITVGLYQEPYPEVKEQQQVIKDAFREEEERFSKVVTKGLQALKNHYVADKAITAGAAFDLFQSYGFPVELTLEIAEQEQITLNPVSKEAFFTSFDQAKLAHSSSSRTASAGKFKGGLAEHSALTTQFHTATHLLHSALRQVLGSHVTQQGSNITNERLRFDFSHPEPLTDDQLQQVAELLEVWISADLPVTKQILPKSQALESGAIAFFKEKYPEEVSVYTIGEYPTGKPHDLEKGWISKEFCGGPHVSSTGEIGTLGIVKEKSVAAGIRRIYVTKGTEKA